MGSSVQKNVERRIPDSTVIIQKRLAHTTYSLRLREKTLELQDKMLEIRTEIFRKYPHLEEYYNSAQQCSQQITTSGGLYRGQVKNGYWHGLGEELNFDELFQQPISYYIGQFQTELKSGKGCMLFTSGEYYVGQFEQGFANGQGIYVLDDQSYYEGNWVNNLQHGKGVIIYRNNSKYEGEFRNGYMWGQGKYTWENGNIFEGYFEKDEIRVGIATYKQDSVVYEGYFEDGVPHGKGRCYNKAHQSYYAGQYVKGERHGIGQTNEVGKIVKGEWENNSLKQIIEQ